MTEDAVSSETWFLNAYRVFTRRNKASPTGYEHLTADYLNTLEAKTALLDDTLDDVLQWRTIADATQAALDEAVKALVAIHAAVGETYKQTNIAKESLVRLAAQQGEKA